MKTAIQEVFSELEKLHPNLFNVYTTEGKEFVHHFHKYIAMEKEQIIEAYYYDPNCDEIKDDGEQYYKQTYKQQEQ